MEVKARTKFVRISSRKVRDLARAITGRPAAEALRVVTLSERKGAFVLGKTLKSAIANAENNHDLAADALVVRSATVDEGPALRRFMPRARGSASPIRKRTSHITVTLSDGK